MSAIATKQQIFASIEAEFIKKNKTMDNDNTINYVPENVPPPFRIFRVKDVKFGAFYATRLLFAYDCEGREWLQNTFAAFAGLMFPVAFSFDLCGIAVWYVCKILYKIFCGVWNLVLKCIEDGFKNSVGVLFKIATILLSLLIIVYKWDVITDLVKGLF